MKLIIDKAQLAIAMNRVLGALSEKSTGSIAFRTGENVLEMIGADKMLTVYSESPCQTLEAGTLRTQAGLLAEVIRELPAGDILLEQEDTWLKVTAGVEQTFTIKLPGIQNRHWSEPSTELKTQPKVSILAKKFAYMIEQVQFCIAHESPRSFGVVAYLHRSAPDQLRLVGTDSFRLSYSSATFDLPEEFLDLGICLSKKALNELLKMCHEGFEYIDIFLSEDMNTLLAQVEGYKIIMTLSAIQFPRYESVIPEKTTSDVIVNRQLMQEVSKRVLLAAGKTKVLHMDFASNALVFHSKNMSNSEGRETLLTDEYRGKDCCLAINGKYLWDVCSASSAVAVRIGYNSEEEPLIIEPVCEPEGCLSRHILVPIRDYD